MSHKLCEDVDICSDFLKKKKIIHDRVDRVWKDRKKKHDKISSKSVSS